MDEAGKKKFQGPINRTFDRLRVDTPGSERYDPGTGQFRPTGREMREVHTGGVDAFQRMAKRRREMAARSEARQSGLPTREAIVRALNKSTRR